MEDIDKAMRLGTNMPMGPFQLADYVGLDICLALMETLQHELGSDKYSRVLCFAKWFVPASLV